MKKILFIPFAILCFFININVSYSYVTNDSIRDVYIAYTHTCAITKGNDLYCWGMNHGGQVGDGTLEDKYKPIKVLENVSEYAAFYTHSCAITTNGDLYCFGKNTYGSVGNGANEDVTTPTKIMENVSKVVVGTNNTCVLKTNKDLYCFGRNNYGQLGDGTTQDKNVPTKIMQGVIDVVSIGNGNCALKTNKDLYCFGRNNTGQIGNNSTTNQLTPQKVLEDVKLVKYGITNSVCALKTNNDMYCWGQNSKGELGDGTTTNKTVPTFVKSNIKDYILRYNITCAINTDNELFCWGDNSNYNIGNGTNTNQLTPLKILDDVKKVYIVNNVTSAIKTNGDVYSWGTDVRGAVGFCADQEFITTPTFLLHDGEDFSLNSYASDITCVKKTNGKLYCWGGNQEGRVGNNSVSPHVPQVVIENIEKAISGVNHICYLKNGAVKCRGQNKYKQMGNDSNSLYETEFVEVLNDVKKISSSSMVRSTCAIKNDNLLYCWGENYDTKTTPTQIQNLENVKDVSVGTNHICAIDDNNDLYCFGGNEYGQLGDGTTTSTTIPKKIRENVLKVALGNVYSCLIDSNKDLYCFGYNGDYRLGDNSTTNRNTPKKLTTLSNVRDVSIGGGTGCAVLENNDLYCWGANYYGEVGNNTTTVQKTPTLISSDVNKVSVGQTHTCATKTNGDLYCWGLNAFRATGKKYDGKTSVNTPYKVEGINNLEDVFVGFFHTCAIGTNKTLYCFGNNMYGIIDGVTSCDPQEIFDGSEGVPQFKSGCERHWNYSNLNKTCTNNKENACLKEGTFICQDGDKDFPSIVCSADSDSCCQDENFYNINGVCYKGQGECKEDGTFYCSGNFDESKVECDAVAGEPREEICDGADNDCDGDIDEDFGAGEECNIEGGIGAYECVDDYNVSCQLVATYTPTFTNTFTPSPTPVIIIVTPETVLPKPILNKIERKVLYVNLPKFDGASLEEGGDTNNVKYRYLVHVRKLKRNGIRDKNYKLGKKVLTYKSKNIFKIKNVDKGIYSVRFRVKIFDSKNHKWTKWSKRNLVEI